MAEKEPETAVGYGASTASKSLSELLARILEQLSLSAWLPAAALTLLSVFVVELGTALDRTDPRAGHADPHASPGAVLASTFEVIGKTSIGGLLLLVAVIVVLTMVTQAFSFESIRLLEGYWGVSGPIERLAEVRSNHWRKIRKDLKRDHKALTRKAWKRAKARIGNRPDFTSGMVDALEAQIFVKLRTTPITDPKQIELVDSVKWESLAPGDLLRRRTNIEKKLEDFPDEKRHVMPTRLGNVLRHWEDETGYGTVESMVDEVFDVLPASLRDSHDEQRGRIDLYCSMLFVMGLVGALAVLRLAWLDWRYAAVAAGTSLLSLWMLYRAAVASARYYGSLLVTIAVWSTRHKPEGDASAAEPPVVTPAAVL